MTQKIIHLVVENIKRVEAVEVTPAGDMVVIGGNNGQGKSSTLDAIEYALRGSRSIPNEPIRKGHDKAKVVLETQDYVITRTFTTKGSYLVVASKDGAVFKSPQDLLDKMKSDVSFDPLAFAEMEPRKQLEVLHGILGRDFTDMNTHRAFLYDERTTRARDWKALKARAEATPFYPDAKEVSVADLLKELSKRNAHNKERFDKIQEVRRVKSFSEANDARLKKVMMQIDVLRMEADALNKSLVEGSARATELDAQLFGMVAADEKAIETQINDADAINAKVRANAQRAQLSQQVADAGVEVDKLTSKIEDLDKMKEFALAKAKFPIPGLGFTESGVSLNGHPFDQASSAERLRVSVAIGAALNPEIKVLLVRNGSLLDEANLKALGEIAKQYDAQVWVEKVSKGKECTIIIEDGRVKEKELCFVCGGELEEGAEHRCKK